ncbi:MAG: hypothetical protein Q9216_001490 [Gyalolechia sp. 2 TL-2023]
MRSSLIAIKSGIHKAACFALYRALLRRGRKVLPIEQAESFGKHTRSAFRTNAKVRGRTAICAALNTGYEVLEDLSARNLNVLRQLKELSDSSRLETQSSRESQGTRTHQVGGDQPRPPSCDTRRRWPHPDATSVLNDLPSPPPGKVRQVPTLVNANHIPFLRFKKPQSPFLSYMIRKKNDEREKRIDRLQFLEELLLFAEDEDEWDEILRENHYISNDNGIPWTSSMKDSYVSVKRVHRTNTLKRSQIAERMFDILQEQKQLAEKEKLERRNKRHQAYKARKAQKEAAAAADRSLAREQDLPATSDITA